eukprot:SAG11_NODE_787_length_7169_cov_4.571146_9_plen_101_part_00
MSAEAEAITWVRPHVIAADRGVRIVKVVRAVPVLHVEMSPRTVKDCYRINGLSKLIFLVEHINTIFKRRYPKLGGNIRGVRFRYRYPVPVPGTGTVYVYG